MSDIGAGSALGEHGLPARAPKTTPAEERHLHAAARAEARRTARAARPLLRLAGHPLLLRVLGLALFLLGWQLAAAYGLLGKAFGPDFGPWQAAGALERLAADGVLTAQAAASLSRLAQGLTLAALLGAPLGVLVGYFRSLHEMTSVPFQLLRMTSPLALVPIALIAFGVGSRPVVFLVGYAALWPIVLSTAHGVGRVSGIWKMVVLGFGGGNRAVLAKVVAPAVLPDILHGIRLAVGVGWIVIVPAEMLGVDSGLGYYILDSRDRFAYDELVATILVIGLLGYLMDFGLRRLKERLSWSA
jgi:NitT/TauT family transport system permease protein